MKTNVRHNGNVEAINSVHFLINVVASASGCVRRQSQESGDHDGHYCVCNATYCDTIPDVTKPHDHAKYTLITSSKNGLRFQVTRAAYENISPHDCEYSSEIFQCFSVIFLVFTEQH